MPIYDFECKSCGEVFEKMVLYSKINEVECPKCKGKKLERLWPSKIGVAFKGTGFYKTDYKKEDKT